jgi:hypothetical protein
MAGNKRLVIFRDKICTDQKYTQKVKWKRSTKLIFLKFSGKKWNIFYNFKVQCCRSLFLCLEVPNVYPPIAIVQVDSYSKVNKIHAAHFWVCMMATVGAFIDCEIRSDFRMGASTLLRITRTLKFAYFLNLGTVHEGTPFSDFSIFAPYMFILVKKKFKIGIYDPDFAQGTLFWAFSQ